MSVNWTNRLNLPETFVNAITTDNHVVNGDISVTQLIDAPQIRSLKRLHDYSLDVVDMIGMFIGSGTHDLLEKYTFSSNHKARVLKEAAGILQGMGEDKASGYIDKMIQANLADTINTDVEIETTLSMEVDGMVLSGTFDRFTHSSGMLEDYKTTSANSMMFPETKKSYNAQLNIYACMLRANGYDVKAARIIALLKDHSKMKIMTNKDYPREPIVMLDIELLPEETVMKYIRQRIALHRRAVNGESIPCTPKERWSKADVWKVMKKGGKRSTKNCITEAQAETFIADNSFKYKPGELYINLVKGEPFRCANGYCSMSSVCPQYKEELRIATESAQDM